MNFSQIEIFYSDEGKELHSIFYHEFFNHPKIIFHLMNRPSLSRLGDHFIESVRQQLFRLKSIYQINEKNIYSLILGISFVYASYYDDRFVPFFCEYRCSLDDRLSLSIRSIEIVENDIYSIVGRDLEIEEFTISLLENSQELSRESLSSENE